MSAWLPTAPCTPQECATHPGPAAGPVTAVRRILTGVGVLTAGVVLSPLVALLGAAGRDRVTRRWSRAVVRGFGIDVRIDTAAAAPPATAPRPGAGTLVVANHVSWLDIALIAVVFPGRNLAKSEIRRWPLLGPVAAAGGTLFVERDRLRALPGTVRTLAAALAEGSRVVVFPEGCTWCGSEHGRFTSAVFQAALDAGVPVSPVRITYRAPGGRSGATAFVGDDSLPASLWRAASADGLTAELTVLPAIPAGAYTDRRALARAAREAVTGQRTAPDPGAGRTPPRRHAAPGTAPYGRARRTRPARRLRRTG